jgi:hypothetical protein
MYNAMMHRLLSAMKSSFWKYYEQGHTTRRVAVLLLHSVEAAMDEEEGTAVQRTITNMLTAPELLKAAETYCQTSQKILGSRKLAAFGAAQARRRIFRHLAIGLQMADSFIKAAARCARCRPAPRTLSLAGCAQR